MGSVGGTVREMSPMVDAVRTAVDGQVRGDADVLEAPAQGLAHLAELLREEVGTLLAVMRERRHADPDHRHVVQLHARPSASGRKR